MDMLQTPVPEFQDPTWVRDLAFLSDLMSHLNRLNLSLQGKDLLITNMADRVKAFVKTLDLCIGQCDSGIVDQFENLSTLGNFERSDTERYKGILVHLKTGLENRFRVRIYGRLKYE